jgi:hypothetical protein
MTGPEADRLLVLLERLVGACERIAARSEAANTGGGKRGRRAARLTGEVESGASGETCDEQAGDELHLPGEVGTARAAEILGVSKDTVLAYREKGILPFRDLAPPGSTKPVYMFPVDAVVRLRTTYQTEGPAPAVPREPHRRKVSGRRKYKHLVIDDEA